MSHAAHIEARAHTHEHAGKCTRKQACSHAFRHTFKGNAHACRHTFYDTHACTHVRTSTHIRDHARMCIQRKLRAAEELIDLSATVDADEAAAADLCACTPQVQRMVLDGGPLKTASPSAALCRLGSSRHLVTPRCMCKKSVLFRQTLEIAYLPMVF